MSATHEAFIADELAQFHQLLKKIRLRLARHLKKQGKDWLPEPQFMDAVRTTADALFKSSSEWRKVVAHQKDDAGALTDDEVHAQLSKLIQARLAEMDDLEFEQLRQRRKQRKALPDAGA